MAPRHGQLPPWCVVRRCSAVSALSGVAHGAWGQGWSWACSCLVRTACALGQGAGGHVLLGDDSEANGIFQALASLASGLVTGGSHPVREGPHCLGLAALPGLRLPGSPHSWAGARGPPSCSCSWTCSGAWSCTARSWTPRTGRSARPRGPRPTSSWTRSPRPRWSWPATRYRGSAWPSSLRDGRFAAVNSG